MTRIPSLIVGLATFLGLTVPAAAQEGAPTFYRDIVPLLQRNCQSCHRPQGANLGGMVAPMALVTYAEVRPWVRSILRQVEDNQMPPWHASPAFKGVFENERSLSEEEVAVIARWARAGAPAGREAEAPPPIAFPEAGWAIGEPDLVLSFDEPYVVADEVEDQYVNFTVDVPEDLHAEDRWMQALEFKPGSAVVHHIIGYAYAPGTGAIGADRGMVGGIAPGNDPESWPEGYGMMLRKGSKFTFAMHYHKEKGPGTATADRSSVGIKFHPKGSKVRPMTIEAIGNMGFEIPPFHKEWHVGAAKTFDRPIEVHYWMPHMHLRGKSATYTAFYPDGGREVLLDVPRYDFNWQTSYQYREPKLLPAGTRVEVLMTYDNSVENAAVPNPTIPVRFGGPTTDEMALGWLAYAYADETPQDEAEAAGG